MDSQAEMFRRPKTQHRARVSIVLLLVMMTAMAVFFAAAPAAAQEDAARRVIAIEASKGRMIRLDVPVKTVFVANPEIADVQIKSPMVMYVTGKKPGETTIIAVDEQDRVLVNISITVNHNLSRLKRTIDAVLPGNRILVRSVDGAPSVGCSWTKPVIGTACVHAGSPSTSPSMVGASTARAAVATCPAAGGVEPVAGCAKAGAAAERERNREKPTRSCFVYIQ